MSFPKSICNNEFVFSWKNNNWIWIKTELLYESTVPFLIREMTWLVLKANISLRDSVLGTFLFITHINYIVLITMCYKTKQLRSILGKFLGLNILQINWAFSLKPRGKSWHRKQPWLAVKSWLIILSKRTHLDMDMNHKLCPYTTALGPFDVFPVNIFPRIVTQPLHSCKEGSHIKRILGLCI